MDKKEYYKETGFIELPERKIVNDGQTIKSFNVVNKLYDVMIKYPKISYEELVDALVDKYGVKKANIILKKLSGGMYDIEETYIDEEEKIR